MVSVIVVNYGRPDDTVTCLRSFDDVDWPRDRLELIVVDNASGDDSAAQIRASIPRATVIDSATNLGFAGGCNLGVEHATGEYVGLINNDARPGSRWIAAAMEAFELDAGIGAVASKVLDWEGRTIDYVDGSLTWYGMGYKREVGQPDSAAANVPRDVLFATGSAMFVRTDSWRVAGGFDDRYFMFYEDVDLGWRLNLLGSRVRYVPGSIAYHRHHASMASYGPWREHFLLERNALFTLYKNYGDDALVRVLPAALALAVRRGISRGGDDSTTLDLARGAPADENDQVLVSKETLAPVYAVDAFIDELPALRRDRDSIQAARRRGDGELRPLFRQMVEPAFLHERYLEGHQSLVDAFGIAEAFGSRLRIVVATGDPLTPKMAGPAIRAWAIADALSIEHEVELVTLGPCALVHPRFRCRSVVPSELVDVEAWCDVFVFGGLFMLSCPWLKDSQKILVVDVYNPFHLEQLEQAKDKGEDERARVVHDCTSALNDQLARGDFFLCASPKQRNFWLGQMTALGRVNSENYDADQSLHSLITVVPFGLPDSPPVHTRRVLKGVVPGIGLEDKVILWGGGIYSWFDPLTLLRAIDRVRRRHPEVRLFFLGMRHPNPDVPEMRMAVATRRLAESLGLTGTHVFFNEDWVEYEDRQNYLLEADLGVSTHHHHVETAFSFRTRMLDYLWASLPIVATKGDSFAQLIEDRGLGITVPPEDVDALEEALDRLLSGDELAAECRARAGAVANELTWARVTAPLLEFCRAPRRAPDSVGSLQDRAAGQAGATAPTGTRPATHGSLSAVAAGLAGIVRRGYDRVRVPSSPAP